MCTHKKRQSSIRLSFTISVGMTRFELATPRPPDVCATGLRYIPKTKGCKYKS